MSLIPRFIALVEYRPIRLLIAAVPLIGLLAALWWPQDARARASASQTIAADLRGALQSPAAMRAS
jgi:di/tricarboxylate transporter